jgi:hypothetical protein
VSEGRRFCENCGAEIGETTNFCPNCGAAQAPKVEVPADPPPETPEAGRISTPEVPGVPPPPQAGGRSWGKIIGIGCGALVLLLLLVVACTVVVASRGGGSSSGGSGSTNSGSSGSSSKQKSGETTVSLNEPITVGDVEWTITDAKPVSQLTQSDVSPRFAKTEQGNYVIVDFGFTNNGSKAVTLDTESLKLVDNQGRESGAISDQAFYVPKDKQVFLERANPGVTKQGEAIFQVAPDASGFKAEAGDTNMFTGNTGYVDLGF